MSVGVDQERVAVVTGVTSGFGKEISQRLVNDGWIVNGLARTADKLNTMREQLGERFIPRPCDISEPAYLKDVRDEITDQFPVLNLLVHSAGMPLRLGAEETSPEDLRSAMDTNYHGAIAVIAAFRPALENADRADIIAITSAGAGIPNPGSAGYSASKAAIGQWMTFLAHGAPDNLGVHDIRPGNANTEGHPVEPREPLLPQLKEATDASHFIKAIFKDIKMRLTTTDVETVAEAVMSKIGQPSSQLYIPGFLRGIDGAATFMPMKMAAIVDSHRAKPE
jgi:3-hydroxy acid dehydrogenase/malonic semialdehyde reductase